MTENRCYNHIKKICDNIDELQLCEEKEREMLKTELLNCQNRNIDWFNENKHICTACSNKQMITCDNNNHAEHCSICQDQVLKIELIRKIRKWLCKRFNKEDEWTYI